MARSKKAASKSFKNRFRGKPRKSKRQGFRVRGGQNQGQNPEDFESMINKATATIPLGPEDKKVETVEKETEETVEKETEETEETVAAPAAPAAQELSVALIEELDKLNESNDKGPLKEKIMNLEEPFKNLAATRYNIQLGGRSRRRSRKGRSRKRKSRRYL